MPASILTTVLDVLSISRLSPRDIVYKVSNSISLHFHYPIKYLEIARDKAAGVVLEVIVYPLYDDVYRRGMLTGGGYRYMVRMLTQTIITTNYKY